MNFLEKRFGMLAIEKGFITEDQLKEAMKMQLDENCSTGSHRQIGKILQDIGLMSDPQIKTILKTMTPTPSS